MATTPPTNGLITSHMTASQSEERQEIIDTDLRLATIIATGMDDQTDTTVTETVTEIVTETVTDTETEITITGMYAHVDKTLRLLSGF